MQLEICWTNDYPWGNLWILADSQMRNASTQWVLVNESSLINELNIACPLIHEAMKRLNWFSSSFLLWDFKQSFVTQIANIQEWKFTLKILFRKNDLTKAIGHSRVTATRKFSSFRQHHRNFSFNRHISNSSDQFSKFKSWNKIKNFKVSWASFSEGESEFNWIVFLQKMCDPCCPPSVYCPSPCEPSPCDIPCCSPCETYCCPPVRVSEKIILNSDQGKATFWFSLPL